MRKASGNKTLSGFPQVPGQMNRKGLPCQGTFPRALNQYMVGKLVGLYGDRYFTQRPESRSICRPDLAILEAADQHLPSGATHSL